MQAPEMAESWNRASIIEWTFLKHVIKSERKKSAAGNSDGTYGVEKYHFTGV